MPDAARAFLTAEWRHLAILTFQAEPALLRRYVPEGTELDTHDGRALISLVGFRFLQTRVLGLPMPFHRHFDEVNLRFYVRREVRGEIRRGVTFIREIVPRRLIAWVARLAYNEPYIALPMRSEIPSAGAPIRVRYAWKSTAGWQDLALSQGPPIPRWNDARSRPSSPTTNGVTRASAMGARWSIASNIRPGASGSVTGRR